MNGDMHSLKDPQTDNRKDPKTEREYYKELLTMANVNVPVIFNNETWNLKKKGVIGN